MNIYSAINSNKRKTWIIIILFIAFITTFSFIIGKAQDAGYAYAVIALILASLTSIGSYFYSDKLVLATASAHEIHANDNPGLYNIVENLTIGSGLPMPRVYIMDDLSLNAFATGRDPQHASICVTSGILKVLNKAELEGVIAHELSHVKNFDIRLMTIVAILVGFIAILGDIFLRSMRIGSGRKKGSEIFLLLGIIFAILSPIIATLIQLAISRKREFLADASGALLTRYPEGLAKALEKIEQDPIPTQHATNATAHLFITNPFKGKETKQWFASLFNTHPPIEERITILRSM